MLHRHRSAVAVVVACCVLSACGAKHKAAKDATSSTASPAGVASSASNAESASAAASSRSPRPTTGYTAKQLSPALLRISDFPTGWKTKPVEADSNSKPIGDCAKKLDAFDKAHPDSKSKVEADFVNPAGSDEIDEMVQGYPTAHKISADIAAFSRILRNCKSITVDIDGKKIVLIPKELSFPTFGDESVAFVLTGQIRDFNIVLNYVVIRRGTILVTLTQAGVAGSLSAPQLRGLATKAVAKLDKQLGSLTT